MVDSPATTEHAARVLGAREACVLAAVRRRATATSPRVVVAVAELAQETGLDPGSVSRALTKLWLDGYVALDQAPGAAEPSFIDLLADEGRGKGGEESEQNSSRRHDLIENPDQIGTICAERIGQAVPGGAAVPPAAGGSQPRAAVGSNSHGAAATSAPPALATDDPVALARECADRLGAYDSLPAFVTLVRRYGPSRLRDALDTVLALPDARIRKSRAALFTFLVKNGT